MLGGNLAAVVFGLASALCWGAGDFSGGLATKRAPVFGVLAIGQAGGLLLLIVLALVWGEPLPSATDLGWGLAAGLAGAVGLASLYRALAIGQMGMVAPVSAVLTAALPALFGALTEGLPGALKLGGFGLALLSIWLVAGIVLGLGTALVYPTLLAVIADVAEPAWRGSAVGVYRLWRDAGFAVGALLAGVVADLLGLAAAIWVVAVLTGLSGLVVAVRMYETHHPATQP